MFVRAVATSASLSLFASTALAGGVAEPIAEEPAAAAAATPALTGAFGGWYGALEMGRASGSGSENPGPGWLDVELQDGTCAGGTIGRNQQRGRLVYGAELRHMKCTDFSGLLGQKPFDGITDLRLRIGTTVGPRTMVYGAIGYSWVSFEAPFGKQTVTGPNAGVGVEFNATDKVFAGLDYTARSLSGEGGETSFDFNVATTTLRLGLRF